MCGIPITRLISPHTNESISPPPSDASNASANATAALIAAVVEAGSFDGAARLLQVTPSAVSQRVKAIEARLGGISQVLCTVKGALSEGKVTKKPFLIPKDDGAVVIIRK